MLRTVKGLRSDLNLDREEYGELIGVSKFTVGNYESFKTVPDVDTAIVICDKSGIKDLREVQWSK